MCLNFKKTSTNTIIGVYYRHPMKKSTDIFNIKFDGTIKNIKDKNKTKCDDFNYNLLNHEYNNQIKNFDVFSFRSTMYHRTYKNFRKKQTFSYYFTSFLDYMMMICGWISL